MYSLDDGALVVSPSDLTKYLACPHAARLDLAVARGELSKPADAVDESLQALFARGIEHERNYLQSLRDRGLGVVEIVAPGRGSAALAAAERDTEQAMADGAEVIYQATFFDGRWRGHADFLIRRDDRPGRWAWSYDVADTKLARRMKVAALLQMATYAQRLTTLQQVAPEILTVVTGDNEERPYRFADCAAYATRVRGQLLEFLHSVDDNAVQTRPEPVQHCGQCRWRPRCSAQWRREDDLSLVAYLRRDQARALREAGITTVRELAGRTAEQLPATIGDPARKRLPAQASLQIEERDGGSPVYELLAPEPLRGLALLPAPSPGDVFFDIEGDPFLGDHGLEYLFGVVHGGTFTAYWATEPAREKAAFEQLVDHLMGAWAADPDMHVYHYAPYEPSRLKALSGRHATRGAEVDQLLRGQRLVDLYAVVRQGIRISKESYSIKKLEDFYWGQARAHVGVSDALGSVVAFERWLKDGDPAILDDIASYNEDDCRSTEALRDWLEKLRVEGGGDASYPRPEHGDGAASEAVAEAADAVAELAAQLLAGVPEVERTEAEQARWLLAGLLDWHRRESLPEWWEHFARLQLTDEQLVNDSAAIGQLGGATAIRVEKQSTVWHLTFPAQDTKLGLGEDAWLDPRTGQRAGLVVDIDAEQGWLQLKRGTKRGVPDLTALVPGPPVLDREQRARLFELGDWVREHGIDSPDPQWRAARDLLLRRRPRLTTGPADTSRAAGDAPPSAGDASGSADDPAEVRPGGGPAEFQPAAGPAELRPAGEPAEQALQRLAVDLDHSVLPVQGPPGTGKTWAGARTVLRLVAAGKRVGITAFSHKAIGNLLDAVCAAADESGQPVRILQKAAEHQCCPAPAVEYTGDATEVEAASAAREIDIVAGTAWLFARPGMRAAVDVLVVDEAGQLSLANVLAVSGSAESVVLLGDPQQLAQPVKGQHPAGAEVSALEHLLDGHATVPPERGLLLDATWRMHSDIASFVSDTCYDARLLVEPDCDKQRVESASVLGGTGLRLITVDHPDESAASTAEADVVRTLCAEVLADGRWTGRDGLTRPLAPPDILVVTPFNAQVNRIRSRLAAVGVDGVRVGTVDKFQGQEAAVVIYSMASSSAEDAPRGIEFLYSLHRFNVAVSRARAVVAVVCSPHLLAPLVRSPQQLKMVNALCAYAERATVTSVG